MGRGKPHCLRGGHDGPEPSNNLSNSRDTQKNCLGHLYAAAGRCPSGQEFRTPSKCSSLRASERRLALVLLGRVYFFLLLRMVRIFSLPVALWLTVGTLILVQGAVSSRLSTGQPGHRSQDTSSVQVTWRWGRGLKQLLAIALLAISLLPQLCLLF